MSLPLHGSAQERPWSSTATAWWSATGRSTTAGTSSAGSRATPWRSPTADRRRRKQGAPSERILPAAIEHARTTGYSDDVVVLAAEHAAPQERLELQHPARPATVSAVRRSLGRWLEPLAADIIDVGAVQHAVGELDDDPWAEGLAGLNSYGMEQATELSRDLATIGHTIVSALAYGVDQAAHRGAILSGGPTIAVMPCGVDRPYPAAHGQLLEAIADRGLIVAEAPPGTAPTRARFLARNRIVAGLAEGAVVVEGAIRSGALALRVERESVAAG